MKVLTYLLVIVVESVALGQSQPPRELEPAEKIAVCAFLDSPQVAAACALTAAPEGVREDRFQLFELGLAWFKQSKKDDAQRVDSESKTPYVDTATGKTSLDWTFMKSLGAWSVPSPPAPWPLFPAPGGAPPDSAYCDPSFAFIAAPNEGVHYFGASNGWHEICHAWDSVSFPASEQVTPDQLKALKEAFGWFWLAGDEFDSLDASIAACKLLGLTAAEDRRRCRHFLRVAQTGARQVTALGKAALGDVNAQSSQPTLQGFQADLTAMLQGLVLRTIEASSVIGGI